MIDHVSIGVSNLGTASEFYEPVLGVLGLIKLVEKPGTVGFGKKYAEFWLNHRSEKAGSPRDDGIHICLRAKSIEVVKAFYDLAIKSGASSSGEPGYRPEYHKGYYAAFIRDQDHNHIEVVTFVQ
jgi:catechol 2,3-dioxygenase-like lactoylglutathione lyase family enzyme